MALTTNPENAAETEAPRPAVSSRLILWLIILGLGILFFTLYLVSTTIKENLGPLSEELASVQETLASTLPPPPEEQALTTTLLETRGRSIVLQGAGEDLAAGHINWPMVMAALGTYNPSQMQVHEITQTDTQVTVGGQANDETIIMAYAETLRSSEQFDQVVVQSITFETLPTPTPTPTLTPVPTTTDTPLQATATPGPAATITPVKVARFIIIVELRLGTL